MRLSNLSESDPLGGDVYPLRSMLKAVGIRREEDFERAYARVSRKSDMQLKQHGDRCTCGACVHQLDQQNYFDKIAKRMGLADTFGSDDDVSMDVEPS